MCVATSEHRDMRLRHTQSHHDKRRMLTLGPFKCLEVTLLSCSPHVLSAILLLPRKAILIEPPHDVKLTRLRSCRENVVRLIWRRSPGAWRNLLPEPLYDVQVAIACSPLVSLKRPHAQQVLLPEPLYDVQATVARSLVEGVDPSITNKSTHHLQTEISQVRYKHQCVSSSTKRFTPQERAVVEASAECAGVLLLQQK